MSLAGCATLSLDGEFSSVQELTRERIGKTLTRNNGPADADSIRQSIQSLLSQPLTEDAAVQIALFNNPTLQATYAQLGIAEADLVQAARLENPGFTFRRTRIGEDIRLERTLTFNVIKLLTAPLATRIEQRRFMQVKLEVTAAALKVAIETRKAYFDAVAAEQGVVYAQQVTVAAEAGADLALRMARAGNFSKLEQAREQAFYAEATAGVARAKKTAITTREKLTRLLGLWGADTAFRLPDRLPDLPTSPLELTDAEALALRERLDVTAAKEELAGLAGSLDLTKASRWVNVLDLSYVRNSETGLPTEIGYEVGIEIPIFDWGSARVAKAEAIYMQAAHRLAATAADARSEVREGYLNYRAAYDLAKHYRDVIVPLRKQISDENLLRYNGMLLSVFELLADAREQVASVNAYIETLKDFWLAEADLQAAFGGRSPASAALSEQNQPQAVQPLPSTPMKGN